jgi:hypothetical protein
MTSFLSLDGLKEYMGMQYKIPDCFKEVVGEEEAVDEGDGSTNDLENFLAGIDFDDDDIPIDATQFPGHDSESVEPSPVENNVEDQLNVYLPLINPNETTFQAFKRLTEQHPWVPFALPDKPRNELEEAEYDYFKQEESKYQRHAAYLNAKNGYVLGF